MAPEPSTEQELWRRNVCHGHTHAEQFYSLKWLFKKRQVSKLYVKERKFQAEVRNSHLFYSLLISSRALLRRKERKPYFLITKSEGNEHLSGRLLGLAMWNPLDNGTWGIFNVLAPAPTLAHHLMSSLEGSRTRNMKPTWAQSEAWRQNPTDPQSRKINAVG